VDERESSESEIVDMRVPLFGCRSIGRKKRPLSLLGALRAGVVLARSAETGGGEKA